MAFVYPTFLAALAAIAVPVILHLVQLRRAKRVIFSNVRFIQASKDLTASQRTLKELLILLCRILFVVFLVLAFAQPFLPATNALAPADASEVTIVVDNSFSMQNLEASQDIPLLDIATDRSKDILSLFPAATAFKVISGSSVGHTSAAQATEAEATLEALEFSARELPIAQTPAANKPAHVFILSDFQKSTFKPTLLQEYDSATQVHLVPLAGAGTSNVTVDSVYLEDAFIRPAADNVLHVRLSNTGDIVREDVPVKLIINDRQVAALSLNLPPQQVTEAILNFRVEGNVAQMAYVQVEDFPVEFDNTYYFVLAPSASITVTEVTSDAANSLKRLYQSEPFFAFTSYSPSNINYAQAETSDILILNGVADLPATLAATAANFVKAGGTLAVIPPARGNAAGHTALFQNLSLPANFTGAAAGATKLNLMPPDPNNPFFSGIFSEYDPKMQMPAAVRSVSWSRASEDVLKYRGGAPFLSRFDRGEGHVFLMAASVAPDYSTLASHALFVPIMYKLAMGSYKQQQELSYTLSGNTIQLPAFRKAQKEGVYVLRNDSLAYIPEQQVRGGKLFFNVPPDMDEDGFYTLQLQDSTLTSLAFNYGKAESYLAQYTPDELRALVGADRKNVHVYEQGDSVGVKDAFEKQFFGVKLWKYCLILCLFFLMAEIALIRLL
ncbi:BatA domain-containing protein [Pontibacter sp. E15-1]|uniref:BatA domain-containing protein n=1 Tax=Pontibacter sp. E15-1 TaxID=2919918 RepID=UPI001F4F1CAB|nr:BatA domain-containing protein [Pontibacter sp. E15-1]MCJ8164840.1 BatA domain-containing protein [Pontibacter sp. E15-1]